MIHVDILILWLMKQTQLIICSAHAKEFVYNPTNGASATIGFRNLSNSSSSNSSSSSNNHTSNIISSSSTNSSNNLPSLSSRQRNQDSSCGGSPASWVDAPEFVPRFAKDNINKRKCLTSCLFTKLGLCILLWKLSLICIYWLGMDADNPECFCIFMWKWFQ